MPTKKINCTKNYRLFHRSDENRPTDLAKHRELYKSMETYGFLPSYPIVCHRNGKGLVVKDGQHRLTFAESLGLPVWWVEEEEDFDIARINCTSKVWSMRDFAQTFAAQGRREYERGLEFCDNFNLPIGIGFAMLAGTVGFTNIANAFRDGSFAIKDRAFAEAVASTYVQMIGLSKELRNVRFLQACMSVCRVNEFDSKRLIQNSQRCREKLVAYSTRDAYLGMLEEVYNFGRVKLFGLKSAALMAMKERDACSVTKRKKAAKSA